jgi:pimeloyl-ACP methyl ester carboxylesterase
MRQLFFIAALSLACLPAKAQMHNGSPAEVVLKTATGDISGTLLVSDTTKSSPLVLIIAGSGPTDRDCNSPAGVNTNAYKMIAQELAKKGISSLRFDKRGIGKSQAAMKSEADLTFDTYIDDVVGWISMLKNDGRFSRILILGHSEGSLIGMEAARQSSVAGFISLAGAGKPADRVLREQLEDKLSPELFNESERILDSLRAGKTVAKIDKRLMMLYRPSVQPYMISWIKYDPAVEIAKLKAPVLIIQGTSDLQVTEDDARLLSSGNPSARLLFINNMNHVLKESDKNIQRNMATYSNPELPLKEGLVDALVKFTSMTEQKVKKQYK